MREPPANLPDATLVACVRAHYGHAVADIQFLPLGHDASAWVYRARADDGGDYFVKVRLRVSNRAGLLVPRYLHDRGVAQVVAPIPTVSGALWARAAGYAVLLYPYVDGATGMERGLTDRQWVEYGALLRRIHDTVVAPDLAQEMAQEAYVPAGADTIERLDADVGARSSDDPLAQAGDEPIAHALDDPTARATDDPITQALAGSWWARRSDIRTLRERAVALGQRLARAAYPPVLCHADAHTANVLVGDDGRVWFVDWDETVLAPRERDLMFAVGGGISRRLVGPREEMLFLQGYGPVAIDPFALAYYRYAWAVADVAAYGEEICYRPDLGPLTRRAALEQFESLFAPGNIVTLAFASAGGAPG